MNPAVTAMLEKYNVTTADDAASALKEIIQEIALLGLHRANFFEKAAFYGGTALRILYSLPRYSEDLDFTLFKTDKDFSLAPYFSAVEKELEAYGFKVKIEQVNKKIKTNIESAFIKANTNINLLNVSSLKLFESKSHPHAKLQIKFEVDTEPVSDFEVETRYLLAPASFPVISLKKPDLFAGKLHALLFRSWKTRVKGRDFYDYVWYLKNNTPVRLNYLSEKAIQSGHAKPGELQDIQQLRKALRKRFQSVDFNQAKKDVLPFIKDSGELDVWGEDFFLQTIERIRVD